MLEVGSTLKKRGFVFPKMTRFFVCLGFCFFGFFVFVFIGSNLWHVKVPRQEVKSEL